VLTSVCIYLNDKKKRESVAIELNVSYPSTILLNENCLIEIEVLKIGKNLAFSNVKFINEKNNEIIIIARQSKSFLNNKESKL
jgi:hypothetical protein